MYVNWWDNPTNPDSWHKHQVCTAAAAAFSTCNRHQFWTSTFSYQ